MDCAKERHKRNAVRLPDPERHQKPNGGGECGYAAFQFCHKCGWVRPAKEPVT